MKTVVYTEKEQMEGILRVCQMPGLLRWDGGYGRRAVCASHEFRV